MWNATEHGIPEFSILNEHLRVLEEAFADAEEFPVWSRNVEEALNYFTARVVRHGGVNLIGAAIRQNRLDLLHEGLAKLKQENGLS